MNYSYAHKSFATNLSLGYNINKQDVLDHPENYLGPNYKELLNYWFYWGSWSVEERNEHEQRHRRLDEETMDEAGEKAEILAKEVIDPRFIWFSEYEDLEIVAAHLYIERGIPFTFLPLIFNL
jgi:hypothetical protein